VGEGQLPQGPAPYVQALKPQRLHTLSQPFGLVSELFCRCLSGEIRGNLQWGFVFHCFTAADVTGIFFKIVNGWTYCLCFMLYSFPLFLVNFRMHVFDFGADTKVLLLDCSDCKVF